MKLSKLAITSFACIAFVSAGTLSIAPMTDGGISVGVDAAQARVGRPLTPVSVAGVARRTTGGRLLAGRWLAGRLSRGRGVATTPMDLATEAK
jgi:hypothetical protein